MRSERPPSGENISEDAKPTIEPDQQLTEERMRELSNAIGQLRQEISVREMAELELSAVRERYDLAAQAAKIGVWDWNVETNDFYLDPNVKAILGYSDIEIPNDLNEWFEYVHPEDREYVATTVQKHLDGKTDEFVNQHRMIHKDGSVRWIMARGKAIRNESGKVVRMVGTDADITGYKVTEIALRESDERYRAVVEQSRDCIFLVDIKSRRVLETNLSFRDLLGYTRDETTNMTIYDFIDHDKADIDAKIQRIVKDEGFFIEERRYRHKDGRIIDVEMSVNLVVYGGEKVMSVVSRDISRRKKTETERKKLEAQIGEAQRLESLGALAGGVAHDFNNILMGIIGSASLALEKIPADSSARELVEQIEASSRRAAELSKQLLAYSGNGRFVVRPINLSELVRDMRDLLAASISIDAKVDYQLGQYVQVIEADATEVRQVLMNLVLNASEAMSGGGTITIATGTRKFDRNYLDSASIGRDLAEGQYVYLEVCDTGIGMDRETVTRIFDPYFSTKQAGRGLGLAAVMGIIKGHRAALRVESKLGEGSVITVLFPISRKQLVPATERPDFPGRMRTSGTVLVVDDDKTIRNLSTKMLESNGYKVLTAEDGKDGIEVFRRRFLEIDIVLLDLTMPKLDGKKTYEELKKIKSDVHVVFSSGYSEETVADLGAENERISFIQKPYHTYELIDRIRRLS